MPGQQIVTNFLGGQVAPQVRGRKDTNLYGISQKTMRNMVISLRGGASTRPGLANRVQVGAAGSARMEPLFVTRTDVFILVFENASVKIYSISGGTITEEDDVAGPWTSTTMWTMTLEKVGTTMVITDQAFFPQLLQIDASTPSLSIGDYPFDTRLDGIPAVPFHKWHGTDVTLTVSATTGTGITVTASDDVFTSDHVGTYLKIRDGYVQITAYTSATVVTADVVKTISTLLGLDPLETREGDQPRIIVQQIDHGFSVSDSVTISGAGIVTGIVYASLNTTLTVQEVLDDDHYVVHVGYTSQTVDFGGSSVRITSAAATRNWQMEVFSAGNYPQACVRHEGRIWFGGTPILRDDRWGSASGSFFDFFEGTGQDDDPIKALGDTADYNIRHLVSNDVLQAHGDTYSSVMLSDPIITPTNKNSKIVRGTTGAAYTAPVRHDGSVLFVDAVGIHIREILPNEQDATDWFSVPVTIATDVMNGPYHSTVFEGEASEATPYAVWTNSDGTVIVFISSRQDKAAAWFTFDTDGTVWSVCGLGERLFVAVERDDGNIYIEEFDFGDERIGADHYVAQTAAATTEWTISDSFFHNKECDIFRQDGGVYLGRFDIGASGEVELPQEETDIYIGLPVDWELEMLPVLAQSSAGAQFGKRERIRRIFVDLYNTIALKVNGQRIGSPATDNVDNPPQNINNQREVRIFGWDRSPAMRCTGRLAERCTILSAVLEMS